MPLLAPLYARQHRFGKSQELVCVFAEICCGFHDLWQISYCSQLEWQDNV